MSSKAPKHFREALYQMANFIGILQAEWAGAQAFSSFDTYLSGHKYESGGKGFGRFMYLKYFKKVSISFSLHLDFLLFKTDNPPH